MIYISVFVEFIVVSVSVVTSHESKNIIWDHIDICRLERHRLFGTWFIGDNDSFVKLVMSCALRRHP